MTLQTEAIPSPESLTSESMSTTWEPSLCGTLAIVGLGPGTEMAPLQDPMVETWGLAWDYRAIAFDKIFEMHSREMGWEGTLFPRKTGSYENYENYPEKFITQDNYPLKDVERYLGREGFTCSIGYMLALGLFRGHTHISLWGVHAANDTEYAYQRDHLLWLLGFASAKGVKISLPADSLLRIPKKYYGIDYPVFEDGKWKY